jgi:hypothetical protein
VYISEEQASNIIRAVEHYAAYLKATNRDDRPYRELAESLQRKPPVAQPDVPAVERQRATVYAASSDAGVTIGLPLRQARLRCPQANYLPAEPECDRQTIAAVTQLLGAFSPRLEVVESPPNPNVHVVALYDGDRPGGNDSFRYMMQPDGQFTQEALGEVNMGDPQTLIDFVRWGKQQAPSDHYYLAIADHANALDGIAWGPFPADTHLGAAC